MKRILTRKSTMKFGKYFDFTVQQIFDLHKEAYIIWCYCNCSEIDFNDDIKEHCHINIKIDKPGKNPDLNDELTKHYFDVMKSQLTEHEWMCFVASSKSKNHKYRQMRDNHKRFSKMISHNNTNNYGSGK